MPVGSEESHTCSGPDIKLGCCHGEEEVIGLVGACRSSAFDRSCIGCTSGTGAGDRWPGCSACRSARSRGTSTTDGADGFRRSPRVASRSWCSRIASVGPGSIGGRAPRGAGTRDVEVPPVQGRMAPRLGDPRAHDGSVRGGDSDARTSVRCHAYIPALGHDRRGRRDRHREPPPLSRPVSAVTWARASSLQPFGLFERPVVASVTSARSSSTLAALTDRPHGGDPLAEGTRASSVGSGGLGPTCFASPDRRRPTADTSDPSRPSVRPRCHPGS